MRTCVCLRSRWHTRCSWIEIASRCTRVRYESVERKTRERRNMKLSRARSADGIAIITPCVPYAREGRGVYIYFWLQSINRTRLKYGSGRTWCSSITGGGATFIYVYTVAGLVRRKLSFFQRRGTAFVNNRLWKMTVPRIDSTARPRARSRKLIVLKKL